MRLTTTLALITILIAAPAVRAGAVEERPVVQLALLLDTSNSMDGLIDQARTQLWKVVNELATLSRDGQRSRLEVALFEYGNDSLPAGEGHIRLVVPLTADLDRISQELWALDTNGGSEYCGQVIEAAASRLRWSSSPRDLRTIFIAGNEEFTQGQVDYHGACAKAIRAGITVNTVFCGSRAEGEQGFWKEAAGLADGLFMAIDQDRKVAEITAPQDAEITRLGVALNETYVPFGASGDEGRTRQAEQDMVAEKAAPAAATQRAMAKSQAVYDAAGWDLVDAVEGGVKLESVPAAQLPPAMQSMDAAQRAAYLKQKADEREQIQRRIQQLGAEREAFVAEARKSHAAEAGDTLDQALVDAIRQQAKAKGLDL